VAAERRRAVVAGATGLVGKSILEGLLADRSVSSVIALARRPLPLNHAKLTTMRVEFGALPKLPPVDEVYLALGTTIKVAGSQSAFRAVDLDANLAVAKAALDAGARRCGLVSAMGANQGSKVFYSRIKGELEVALSALPFDGLVIARPSLLVGDRRGLGQPERHGERIGRIVGELLGRTIPSNLRPIAAGDVAGALLARVPTASGHVVVASGEMRSGKAN
jgi:uncharacterized protein YbjT (DUF2867 family)